MSSSSPVRRPDHPVTSQNPVFANKLTIFEVVEPTRWDGLQNGREIPKDPEDGEDDWTLTERVLTLLDKRGP
jgi:hypothetical protein